MKRRIPIADFLKTSRIQTNRPVDWLSYIEIDIRCRCVPGNCMLHDTSEFPVCKPYINIPHDPQPGVQMGCPGYVSWGCWSFPRIVENENRRGLGLQVKNRMRMMGYSYL